MTGWFTKGLFSTTVSHARRTACFFFFSLCVCGLIFCRVDLKRVYIIHIYGKSFEICNLLVTEFDWP